ncbi:MAG: ABC transporter permease [Chloroflexota bacterium]
MTLQTIRTLVIKDLTLYFRDRFFALVTVLALVAYAIVYFVMPSGVDETLNFALYGGDGSPLAMMTDNGEVAAASAGIAFETVESLEALQTAVLEGDYTAGVALPDDFMQGLSAGQPIELTLYLSQSIPAEVRDAVSIFFDDIGYRLAGAQPTVTINQTVLGQDMAGQQIPLRDRVIPMFVIFLLLTETMGLASLITEEVETRTVRALLVTPMNVPGLFVSKGIVGVGLAFTQALILMAVTGGLEQNPLLVIVLLLLGSLLVTGVAFLIASVARDLMSVIGWGILGLIVLIIPGLALLFPGTSSDWMQVFPTYHLVDGVDRVINFGAGWGDVTGHILALVAFCAVIVGSGTLILRRKLYAV